MLAEDSDSAASSGDEMLDMEVPFSQQSASTSLDKSAKGNKGAGSEDNNNNGGNDMNNTNNETATTTMTNNEEGKNVETTTAGAVTTTTNKLQELDNFMTNYLEREEQQHQVPQQQQAPQQQQLQNDDDNEVVANNNNNNDDNQPLLNSKMGSWSDDDSDIEIVDNNNNNKFVGGDVFNNNSTVLQQQTQQQQQQQTPMPLAHDSSNNGQLLNSNNNVMPQQQQQQQQSSYVDTYNQARQQHQIHHQQQRHQQQQQPLVKYISLPNNHTPNWLDIIPNRRKTQLQKAQQQQQRYQQQNQRKRFILSLINMWEFTLTIETLDYYGGYGSYSNNSYYNNHHQQQSNNGGNDNTSMMTLRTQIKKIAKNHIGQGGRKGALFEKGSMGEGIIPDDPILKSATINDEGNADNNESQLGKGKWRIPLGAYHTLMTYLTSSSTQNIVEGIPPEQLHAATLGRERMDKKSYATVTELRNRGVSKVVCDALAPYQRAGVEFILDKDGRALLADEMGLGKTVQAIAAMSAYMTSDWPLLVLCPSTARYHWEAEVRHWLGKESKLLAKSKAAGGGGEGDNDNNGEGSTTAASSASSAAANNNNDDDDDYESMIRNDQINVLTSGKDTILKSSTRVVICSIGLIVNLVNSNRICPGLFRAIIFDESHALKSKSTKRTKAVVPILKSATRCLLLSGTPALAKPEELWPQLSVLGSRRKNNNDGSMMNTMIEDENSNNSSGIWCDESEFMLKYAKGKELEAKKSRLAELHTLLTSTVMIRRMKADILKNLPPKIREKAYVNIEDQDLRNEFRTYMQLLRQGRGVLGKMARTLREQTSLAGDNEHDLDVVAGEDGVLHQKEVLHHLYNITGRSKVARVTKMLQSWLADPTKGKLCIFAHHLDVLDQISRGAGLSNAKGSTTKYIRIDGSTNPKARQEQILRFQTDPAVRIAMLGITAAGVAVTLTASSTVWFTELFWTPAIMIQAEDRCHRIGQQARVRCLYFIGRGTLDEVLWKLIEKKFRDLGEFVEGKENMGIALERELEDDEGDEILKTDGSAEDENDGDSTRKRKAPEDVFADLLDTDDLDLKQEIDELCHEEEDMLNIKNEEEEDEPDIDETKNVTETASVPNKKIAASTATGASSDMVIELSDDEDEDIKPPPTIATVRERYRESRVFAKLKIEPTVQFNNLRLYTVKYPGPAYGLLMVACNGRVIVKSHQTPQAANEYPKIGSIIVACNGYVIPYGAPFHKVLMLMKAMMSKPPVTVTFAEDDDFTGMFLEDFIPNLPTRTQLHRPNITNNAGSASSSATTTTVAPPPAQRKSSGVIELLDDDD